MLLQWYIISFFCVTGAIADWKTDFYCTEKQDEWSICRRCPKADKKCDRDPSGCYCENIVLKVPQNRGWRGGSNCTDGFCFVSQNSDCSDVLTPEGYDPHAYALSDAWHHDKIFKSKQACLPQNKKNFDTGNKEIMEGVKIIENALHTVKETAIGNTLELDPFKEEPLVFYAEDRQECRDECKLRCGICGAWSYDELEGNCYLHTADACCGQNGKQERNSGWSSGYFCTKCWSTAPGTECPCSLKKRLEGQLGCSLAQSSGAANDPHYTGPTGELRVDRVPFTRDKCKCERKTIRRRGRRRTICRKPICHDSRLNPCGECKDQRRCRKSRPNKIQPC